MKFTEIQWEDSPDEDEDNDKDEESSDHKDLLCPVCGMNWLNVSEELGEFNENECDHLMFRWYQDGDPEKININLQDLENAFREALLKVDDTIIATEPETLGHEVNFRRTDREFWEAFNYPGMDEIVYGLNDNGHDIFGIRKQIPEK